MNSDKEQSKLMSYDATERYYPLGMVFSVSDETRDLLEEDRRFGGSIEVEPDIETPPHTRQFSVLIRGGWMKEHPVRIPVAISAQHDASSKTVAIDVYYDMHYYEADDSEPAGRFEFDGVGTDKDYEAVIKTVSMFIYTKIMLSY